MAGPITEPAKACSTSANAIERKARPQGNEQGAGHRRDDRGGNRRPLVARHARDHPSRDLARHPGDRADAQRGPDRPLGPADARQINRDERPEAGLKIRDKEIQPVEPAQAAGLLQQIAADSLSAASAPRHHEAHRPDPSEPSLRAGRGRVTIGDRLIRFLVFGRGFELIASEIESNDFFLFAQIKAQGIPVDRQSCGCPPRGNRRNR